MHKKTVATFRMDWGKLLSKQRCEKPETTDSRTPFERDYGRIVFSASFRRLAKKTQVHPFAEIAEIHTRLTHSLEVASVGRTLGADVYDFISKDATFPTNDWTRKDISCIVESACLAHDIGNPPFGHAGEYAIRDWAEKHKAIFEEDSLNGIKQDWLHFDGNAQAFRMLSRSDISEQVFFVLTYATLGATIKYPWTTADERAAKKANVFSTEASIFNNMANALGLERQDGRVARHPLSFLSEAADDICYRIADLEDAVQMTILPEEKVQEVFAKIIGAPDNFYGLPIMRAHAIVKLFSETMRVFTENYDSIMAGTYERPLKDDFQPHIKEALDEREQICESYIYSHRRKVATEIGAYAILGKILSAYTHAAKEISERKDYDELSFINKRLCILAWGEDYVREHSVETYAWWMSRVLDFVAGMTDDYATQVATEIQG